MVPEDLAVVAQYEGVAISVTGFVAATRGVIVEGAKSGSKGESTNCHAVDDSSVDWHVTLVPYPEDPKSAGIVVEATPRIRRKVGFGWTPAMIEAAAARGNSVRISGWLMYDPEHFAQSSTYDPAKRSPTVADRAVRTTLWEIHPVTKIEIFDQATGAWSPLPGP